MRLSYLSANATQKVYHIKILIRGHWLCFGHIHHPSSDTWPSGLPVFYLRQIPWALKLAPSRSGVFPLFIVVSLAEPTVCMSYV